MITYSNIRKEGTKLWAVDIHNGEDYSTVYASKKSDITIWIKDHGFTDATKKITHKKSLEDISKQFYRMSKSATPERFKRIAEIEKRYRYNILERFNCVCNLSDRAYYTPVSRKCYAGY